MELLNNYKQVWEKWQKELMVLLEPNDLTKVSTLYAHDRWPKLRFAHRYQSHFAPLKKKKLKILAIGIGGYDDNTFGGESLKTWKKYFPNSMVYGLDIVDKRYLEEDRIKILHGDQNDEDFIKKILDETGELDIVIEDGSSANEHHIKAFHTFFPALKDGGIYAAENIHHSYWPSLTGERWKEFAKDNIFLQNCISVGGSLDLNDPKTVMNMFKKMVDGLNYEEFLHPGYVPTYFDQNIASLHFYHNLVIVYKGENNEGSNFIENNTLSPEILELFGVKTLDELGLEFPKKDRVKTQFELLQTS